MHKLTWRCPCGVRREHISHDVRWIGREAWKALVVHQAHGPKEFGGCLHGLLGLKQELRRTPLVVEVA